MDTTEPYSTRTTWLQFFWTHTLSSPLERREIPLCFWNVRVATKIKRYSLGEVRSAKSSGSEARDNSVSLKYLYAFATFTVTSSLAVPPDTLYPLLRKYWKRALSSTLYHVASCIFSFRNAVGTASSLGLNISHYRGTLFHLSRRVEYTITNLLVIQKE